jgi:hypothetical protein
MVVTWLVGGLLTACLQLGSRLVRSPVRLEEISDASIDPAAVGSMDASGRCGAIRPGVGTAPG